MTIGRLFKLKTVSKPKIDQNRYGGIIKQLHLESFWHSLKEEEKDVVREGCKKSFGISNFHLSDVDSPHSKLKTRRNVSSFLIGSGCWAFELGHFHLSEKLLLKSIEYAEDFSTIHVAYNWLIKMHYQLRTKFVDSLSACMMYCKYDIDLLPFLIEERKNMNKDIPQVQSLKILPIIYQEIGIIGEEEDVMGKINKYHYI
ncbi:hypothetical protein LCL95_16785 [Bacillus timonensis]|nr:hypothetical protein [Bacillus timonensis]